MHPNPHDLFEHARFTNKNKACLPCSPRFAFALLSAFSSASAPTATPGITARQRREQACIRRGVRSGEPTHPEAARLPGREVKIRQDKREAKADGALPHEEREVSRTIYCQKHGRRIQH